MTTQTSPTATVAATRPTTQAPPAKKSLTILFAAAFAAFLATFNETFFNVAFTPIMADFGIQVHTVQWLATDYMLGAAIMTPTAGFFFRRFPTKPLFLATTALLVVGSIISAIAPSFAILLTGRIIQSLGTGLLMPIAMNTVLAVAPREKLGTFMGLMGAMTTLGPSIAILISGIMLQFAPWRALAWIFAGLALLCLIVGAIVVYNISEMAKTTLDALSVTYIAIALLGILYGLSTIFGPAKLVAVIALIVGLLALAAFVVRQNRSSDPLIDLAPLKIFPFTAGVLINVIALILVFAMNILVPLHLQSVHGASGLQASLVLFPAILMAVIFGPIAGRIYDKRGAKEILPLGMALMAIFVVVTAWTLGGDALWIITVAYIPAIVGSALAIGPVQSFALSSLPGQLKAHGVTLFSTSFQVAGCIGSALSTGIYAALAASSNGTPAEAANRAFLVTGVVLGVLALIGAVLGWTGTRAKSQLAPVTTSVDAQPAHSLVGKLMKTDIYHLAPGSTVRDALALFIEKKISGAPIIADGRLAGFISDGDILSHIGTEVPRFTTPYSFLASSTDDGGEFDRDVAAVLAQPASSIATEDVQTLNVNMDLGHVSSIFADKHLKKAPVVDDSGAVLGIINRSDINRYLVGAYLG